MRMARWPGVELWLRWQLRHPTSIPARCRFGPASLPIRHPHRDPVQARAMDKADIRDLRRWHRQPRPKRARSRAGFDIVYVYAATRLPGSSEFPLAGGPTPADDEYGGSLENRVRLIRELIEDTKEAVGDSMRRRCALQPVDELDRRDGPVGRRSETAR